MRRGEEKFEGTQLTSDVPGKGAALGVDTDGGVRAAALNGG